jgi:Holliday junction resolvasome RuvABC endonuclease subunit
MVTLLGIDPGSFCGLATLVVDKGEIKSIKTRLITDAIAASYYTCESNAEVSAETKALLQCDLLLNHLYATQPERIGIESAYFTGSFPNAFLSLTLRRRKIEAVIRRFSSYDIEVFAPMRLKKEAGAKSTKKEDMTEGLRRLGLTKFTDIDAISEHEIDAIAVALAMKRDL